MTLLARKVFSIGLPFLVVAVIFFVSTDRIVSKDNLPRPEKLKAAIAESISLPFGENEVYYSGKARGCGNQNDKFKRRNFHVDLEDSSLISAISRNNDNRLLTHTNSRTLREMECKSISDPRECSEYFFRNKAFLRISGWVVSNTSVEIKELYMLGGKRESVIKLFVFQGDKWVLQRISNTSFLHQLSRLTVL